MHSTARTPEQWLQHYQDIGLHPNVDGALKTSDVLGAVRLRNKFRVGEVAMHLRSSHFYSGVPILHSTEPETVGYYILARTPVSQPDAIKHALFMAGAEIVRSETDLTLPFGTDTPEWTWYSKPGRVVILPPEATVIVCIRQPPVRSYPKWDLDCAEAPEQITPENWPYLRQQHGGHTIVDCKVALALRAYTLGPVPDYVLHGGA